MRRSTSLIAILPLIWACGGQAAAVPDAGGSSSGMGGSGGSGSGSGSTSGSSSGSTSGSSSGTISGSSSGGSSGSNGGGSTSSSGGGVDGGHVPVNHRTGDGECSMPPAAGSCSFMGGPTCPPGDTSCCTSDSTCTQGTNGRCNPIGPLPGCQCNYDGCQHDTDCGAGHACACHGTADVGTGGNSCVPGNCRVDSDCGSGGYCSPSLNTMSCGEGVAGYYCHTANDQCVDDTDCASTTGPSACTYSTSNNRWECTTYGVCALRRYP